MMFERFLPKRVRFQSKLETARAEEEQTERKIVEELMGLGVTEAFAYHVVRPMSDIVMRRLEEIERIGPSFMA